ncbi:MarR family transcriptional regulator [Leptotrichia trevisanii]|uniref:MarR family transcriptional regulator n=1 Tax=Leptotrichia trevisanii TaxID=109328 RepID=A0A510KTY2_9FUSO|nr:MarR family transcriptional regulator [Leptotrichia trevisanii]BBM46288.1 MarR family transcriptional regulator [Leptotrichia trevisanii]BBM53533.1 MarR family transcriptional regulator [Leptotrichia trevisanii]BBM58243.1 MarR family transcriptional regulator [Leptotrichia trevisanii]
MINLFELVEEINKKFLERYYEISEGIEERLELSERDFYYLRIILEAQKMNLTEFSKISKVSKPAGTKIINKYLKKGYVIKEVSEEDKRFSYIQLSDELKNYLEKDQQIANRIYESFLGVLNKNEREMLEKLLVKIKSNFKK